MVVLLCKFSAAYPTSTFHPYLAPLAGVIRIDEASLQWILRLH